MKLNKVFIVLACSALSLNVLAADETSTLTVSGTIASGACTPSLDGDGHIDYGQIAASTLTAKDPAANALPTKNINLTINCGTSPSTVGFSATDNRTDSMYYDVSGKFKIPDVAANGNDLVFASVNDGFGLGKTVSGWKTGAFGIVMSPPTVDGESADLIQKHNDEAWEATTFGALASGRLLVVTAASTGTLTPLAFKQAVFPLVINAAVRDLSEINPTGELITIDGNATISLNYL
ncbi:DUF1120 domain-containing protein (plasmid) [Hafnia alvei]|uniref:DUF1120 domain-containing protein n=1 Tax=Hafnia alvei TaxID=569 RepID=UPI0016427F74|nr:DUF1120 domain-containing protein [Hafnia alvei]MBI0278591.1 DUF1120 domain-containing protein [Hafnia alvei]